MPPIRRNTVRKSVIPVRASWPSNSNPAGEEYHPTVSDKSSFDSEMDTTGISPAPGSYSGESATDGEGRGEAVVDVSRDEVVLVENCVGSKEKKLVKKKVKVVRKMMVKVMKKVPKARIHDASGVIPSPNPNPNLAVSCPALNVGNEARKERKTEIFVGGLDMDAKEEDIRKVFGEVGEIVDITMVNDDTVKDKGYAFVQYATAEEAKLALEKFSKVKICGQLCDATSVEKDDTIYLRNIEKRWKDEDVLKFLLGIGIEKIDYVRVMVNPRQGELNHGFALVELETRKDAQIAYKKLQEEDVFGKNRTIHVAWAKPLTELDEDDFLKKRNGMDEPFGGKCVSAGLREEKRPAEYTCAPPPAKRNRCDTSGCSSAPLEDPLLEHSPGGLVPSTTALKAKVASLEKQMIDTLKRALKAEAAKSKAEEYSDKKLEEKKNEIKSLKKKQKDEIKKLKRKHKATLKNADHHYFKKGKEYQLDLIKEALAFFDAEFRYQDFAPTLKYIEDERQKILDAAAQQVHLEAKKSASRSTASEPIDKEDDPEEGPDEQEEEQDQADE